MSSLPVIAVAAYLLGSVPTGLWLARARSRPDPRAAGSGSTGATNILRTQGWRPALVVAGLDVAKGWIAAAWIAALSWPQPADPALAGAVAGVAAVAGHIWPALAGFRGGKGVATAAGAALALSPLVSLLCFAVFFATLLASRRVSVASLAAAACLPPGFYLASSPAGGPAAFAGLAAGVLIALLIGLAHRGNIRNLLNGTEPKIGEGSGSVPGG